MKNILELAEAYAAKNKIKNGYVETVHHTKTLGWSMQIGKYLVKTTTGGEHWTEKEHVERAVKQLAQNLTESMEDARKTLARPALKSEFADVDENGLDCIQRDARRFLDTVTAALEG
jgi:hypothetical protein